MYARYLACASALFALMVVGSACKGGGDGPGSDFLLIERTSPVDGSDSVQVAARIGFQVNEARVIDPATLNGSTFFLTHEDGTVITGTYEVGGDEDDGPDVAVMIPSQTLDVLTSYTATITTGLVADEFSLEESFTWSFSTLDSEWGDSDWVETINTGSSGRQDIAVDARLSALAVWEYEEQTGTSIYANRYTRVDLWGEPEPIDGGSGGAGRPAVAVDDAGNGFAVWERSDDGGLSTNVWGNRYTVDQGWGTPEPLAPGLGPSRAPSVAADPNGNAFAVWVQRDLDSGDEIIVASRYEPATGWSGPTPIDPSPSLLAGNNTAVEMDDEGNAFAVWSRSTAMGVVLWANRYEAGGDWGDGELAKPDPDTNAFAQRLAVGPGGEAFLIWLQGNEGQDDVWSSRYTGTEWEAPLRLESHGDDKSGPDIAVDGSGIAYAIWSQTDPDFANIYSVRYAPGSGWGAPQLIEDPIPPVTVGTFVDIQDSDAVSPRIDVNPAGNVFAVWRQDWEDWGSIWTNRLDPGTDWMTPERIEEIERTATNPIIVVDDERHAHAVWLHSVDSGVSWVRTNRFE